MDRDRESASAGDAIAGRHATASRVIDGSILVRLTLSGKGPLSSLILNFRFFPHFPFSTVSRAEGGAGLLARGATTALSPFFYCKLVCAIIRHTKNPPLLHVASTTTHLHPMRVRDLCVERRVEQHTLEAVLLQPSCCHTNGSRHRSRFGCSGHGPVLARGSPAVRKRKPRRLRQEGAVGGAIMISDTRGLWHADMIRSAAALPRGAKPATDVLDLVLIRWRLASTDAGSSACTSWSVVDSKQVRSLDSWNPSAWQRQQAPSAVLPLARESPRTRTASMHFLNLGQSHNKVKKKRSRKSRNPQVGVLPFHLLPRCLEQRSR